MHVCMYVCRCFGKSLEMLRHKVIATNIQRIKVQEISSTIVNTPMTHTNSNSNSNNGQTNGRANKMQSNISTTGAVGSLDENNNNDIDFNYFDDNSNNNAATSNNNSNNVKSRSSNNGNNNNNNSGGNTHKGPRSFECEVRGAMVGHTCIPGDMVNIVGVVKTISVSHCF